MKEQLEQVRILMPPHPLTNFEIYYESEPKIIANFCRILANDPIMCGYFCIGFIDFML